MAKDRDTLSPEELHVLPRSFVIVRKRLFRMTVFRRMEETDRVYSKSWSCPIAVGAIKYSTPSNLPCMVMSKARYPDWQMPYSDWVPQELQGTIVPGGTPENPIKEAFLQLTPDGIGIHGTDNLLSLGTKASHGCIRISEQNAIKAYETIAVGTPVYIR